MKLNGLTNSLAGNDKSLSNSYLQHIVELLRTEVASLTAKESGLETITKEHIETQKEVVDTKTVNTLKLNANTATVGSINEKIILTNVVDVLTRLRVNGRDVLTDASFSGPFTYKGVVETLPVDAVSGDVYITNDKVNIYNGDGWNEFILPVGTVSLAEYNEDKTETLSKIADVQVDVDTVKEDLATTKSTLNEAVIDINDINTKLETKVTEAPVDDNSYVRKNGEWVDLTSADNTVKHTAGESFIDNSEEGISMSSPKVEITTGDFKINGSELPEVNKLALSKTTETDTNYWYELKYGRSPFDATSSIRPSYAGYGASWSTLSRSNPTMYTIFTKNWQYTKWASTAETDAGSMINITAMDKDGNINLISNNFTDWYSTDTRGLRHSCFMSFNPEYVPEGYEDTTWLFCTGIQGATVQKAFLVELKDGKFSRKIDLYNKAGGLKDQGYVPSGISVPPFSFGATGGKSLRNKDIQRICITGWDVENNGSSFAIIIGGDKNSKANDPFDPSKCIYVKLPSTAYFGYQCMAATDSAWYLQEYETGRMMRLTPNGQVVELNLTAPDWPCAFNYIEYTDINGKPAVAYYVQDTKRGKNYVLFLEESDNGQVNFIERMVTSSTFTPDGRGVYSQFFKFMENSYYIFFTADCGSTIKGDTEFGSAQMKNMLWYWDKKTHTTHVIKQFYDGLTLYVNDFIEMHKTKGNAIWFPYLKQGFEAPGRTGDIHYISDVDYTYINEETGKDEGEIQVQTASVGTKYSFFTATNLDESSFLRYTHVLAQDSSGSHLWAQAYCRSQLSATNDDGILCIISGDAKAIALCYGDGNIRLYPISSHPGTYSCDADKEPYLPDLTSSTEDWYKQPNLSGMSHGWVFQVYSKNALSTILPTAQVASYTYIGLKYKNGEPNILEAPYLSKIVRCGECKCPQRIKWEKYGYSQTYDDYERRRQTLGGIRAHINYAGASTGADGYFKEVISGGKDKLNLTYNNKVISSVEE